MNRSSAATTAAASSGEASGATSVSFGRRFMPKPPAVVWLAEVAGAKLGAGGGPSSQGDVPVLAPRPGLALARQGLERRDDLRPRLVRNDHVVDVAALGGRVRVGEVGLVVV